MIVRIVFIQKKENLSIDEFRRHWRTIHAPIAATIPRLQSYIQYDLVGSKAGDKKYPRGSLAIDGVATLGFDDMQSIGKGFTPEIIHALVEDEEKFIGSIELLTTVPRTVIPLANDTSLIRQITLLKRRTDVDADQFQRKWWGEHSELARSMPGIQGFIQNIVIDHGLGREKTDHYEESPIDAVEEICFHDILSLEAALTSPAAQELKKFDETFIGESMSFIVESHRIV